ncbi:hypothetical protein [Marivita sp. GX14005]|uniref:hypothetical protein n=1 Tax=Marivita sp. GX14005 TaxID=2942276 RepID=UPI0020193688|nr:hypothetical protein [Marivita sp. GX14005]MCL3880881.1 hypothetical protein [Marivita sp. GX14005]
MILRLTAVLVGFSALFLSACDDFNASPGQAMPADETGIISPDDNDTGFAN